MINLSTLSKAIVVSWGALVLAVGVVVCQYTGMRIHPVAYAAMLIFTMAALYYLYRLHRTLETVTQVMEASARGDINVRIQAINEGGSILRFMHAVNRLIDISDAYLRESRAMLEHAAEEKYYRKIVLTGFQGAYSQAADMINTSMDTVRNNLVRFMDRAGKDLLKIAETGITKAQQLSVAANDTSNNVNTVAAAVEELSASIGEVSSNMAKTRMVAHDAVQETKQAQAILHELVQSEEKIYQIVGVINTVNEKINLLALNATIEAARAGDAGKGFSVVASEVKNLANQTEKATEGIAANIEKTRTGITNMEKAMGTVGEVIKEMDGITVSVAAALEEQSVVTKEISGSIQKAAGNTQDIVDAANHVFESSTHTANEAKKITESLQQMKS